MRSLSCLLFGLVALVSVPATLSAAEPSADEAAIRKNAAAYAESYNRRDAKALAAMWSETAHYVNPTSGTSATGRAAIEKEFAAQFAGDNPPQLEVAVDSVRFLTADVAIEEGRATIHRAGEIPAESTYTAVNVKQGGKWLLDTVRETDLPTPPSHYAELKELEWLVGEWQDDDKSADVRTKCQWTKNRNFLTISFSVSVDGQIQKEGTQVIGWDAAQGRIRSWLFDSEGGFAEAVWTRKENRWTVESVITEPEGTRGSSVNVYTLIDANTFSWESTGRVAGGEILPNVGPVKVLRQAVETK